MGGLMGGDRRWQAMKVGIRFKKIQKNIFGWKESESESVKKELYFSEIELFTVEWMGGLMGGDRRWQGRLGSRHFLQYSWPTEIAILWIEIIDIDCDYNTTDQNKLGYRRLRS